MTINIPRGRAPRYVDCHKVFIFGFHTFITAAKPRGMKPSIQIKKPALKGPVMLVLLNKYTFFKQIILYGIIGSICAGIDYLFFLLLRYFNLNLYFSNFISINIGILISFLLNTFFNFKRIDKLLRRAIKFFSVGYSGLLVSMFLMYIGVNRINLNETIVKLLTIFIVAAYQFTINKLFTFRI
jgi:putative flippase GtrA